MSFAQPFSQIEILAVSIGAVMAAVCLCCCMRDAYNRARAAVVIRRRNGRQ